MNNYSVEWWINKLNSNDLSNMPDKWQALPEVQTAHVTILNELVAKTYHTPEFSQKRGIVIGAGGAKFFACAFACFYTLRKLGCVLPFEFWYLDDYEMDNKMIELAAFFGIHTVNAKQFCEENNLNPRILSGWELKPFSVLHSKFEEVLYLDADNIPTRDPSFLFDEPLYKKHGSIFWPDLRPSDRSDWLPPICWENVGLNYDNSIDFETGQFLINKKQCYKELNIAMWMNEHSDWFYKFVYGDKSTFHLAWKKCGTAYAMPERGPGWKDVAILQYDLNRLLLFQHACQGKERIVAGDNLNSLINCHLVYEAKNIRSKKWSGNIYSWHEMNEIEKEFAKKYLGSFYYERVGLGSRTIVLSDNGIISEGAAGCERRWCVRIINNSPCIVVIGGGHKDSEVAMFFAKPTDSTLKTFNGKWNLYEQCQIILNKL